MTDSYLNNELKTVKGEQMAMKEQLSSSVNSFAKDMKEYLGNEIKKELKNDHKTNKKSFLRRIFEKFDI